MRAIIHAAIFTPMSKGQWGLPLIFVGKPGIGKSEIICDVCRDVGLPYVVVSPAEYGAEAFGVVPVPSADREWIEFPKPSFYRPVAGGGVIFFDELNILPEQQQGPLMGAIKERRIGSHFAGKRVRVFGAMNPVECSAGGHDLAAPIANRVGHFPWRSPTQEEWGGWLRGLRDFAEDDSETPAASIDAAKEEARVKAGWYVTWTKWASAVDAFTRRRPELLYAMPGDPDTAAGVTSSDPGAASKAWASHRTWEYATRALASSELHSLASEDRLELVASFIGGGAAGELDEFLAKLDLPDPEAVLDGSTLFEHDPMRLDRSSVVLTACAELVKPATAKNRKARAARLWKLLDTISRDAADIVVQPGVILATAGLNGLPEATSVLARLDGLFRAAGVRVA